MRMSQESKPSGTHTDTQDIVETTDERTGGSRVWAFAAVAIVLILTVGFTAWYFWGVFNTTTKVEQVISNTIGELKKESKLVVLTAEITVHVKRSSTKRILWDRLDLGTTVVEMRVMGNKVQYVVPTTVISRDTFRWDGSRGEVVVDIPSPILDEEIVEVQSDPSRIEVRKDVGWGRFESYSGDFLEDQIRRELRSMVIQQGKHELLLDRARKNAEEAIRDLFSQFMKREKVEIPIRIHIH
jgi:hypothetical protein